MRHHLFGILASFGVFAVVSSGCTPTERNFGSGAGGVGGAGGAGGEAGTGGMGVASSSSASSSSGNAGGGGMSMCAASTADCDMNGSCETNLLGDINHCGACDNPCLPPMGSASDCVAGKCVFTCPMGTMDCDQNPATECQAVNNDPKNCGACGHDCLGGSCNLGQCQPVFVLNTNMVAQSRPVSLAVFNNEIYWGTEGIEVAKAAMDGSASMILATVNGSGGVYGLAVTNNAVYATNGSRMSIISHSGGVMWQSVNDGGVNNLAANNFFVVWTATGTNRVRRADVLGGNQKDFANIESGPTSIVLDGTVARWLNSNSAVIRESSVLDNSIASNLYFTDPNPNLLFQDGQTLYWVASNMVWRATIGSKEEALFLVGPDIRALAVDEQNIYLIKGSIGEVWRASKAPPHDIVVIANGLPDPVAMAIGPDSLFWANRGDGSILRWARLP